MGFTELLAARFVLSIIFMISGFGKLSTSQDQQVDAIMDYRVLSRRQAQIAAPLLPLSELVLAILCIVGVGLPIVAGLMILLLATFTVAIAANVTQGRRFKCHCFGSSSILIGPAVIVRNGLLIAIAAFVIKQSLALITSQSTIVAQWQADLQTIAHADTLTPLVASIFLMLSILFLISEMDVVLNRPVAKKKEEG